MRLLRPSNYSQARRQGVLSRYPPSLESAAIRSEDDDVLVQNFQETPQFFLYLILLLALIRCDTVMRHRSACMGHTTSPCCNCNDDDDDEVTERSK